MSRTNDITGAVMTTKAATDMYRDGYDRIFGKKQKLTAEGQQAPVEVRQEMSDREWAAQSAGLREGCTVHVPGVGDI